MTRTEDPDKILEIMGVERHPTRHYARAVTADQRIYILHSQACVNQHEDLRDCGISMALDGMLDESVRPLFDWELDKLLSVRLIQHGHLAFSVMY